MKVTAKQQEALQRLAQNPDFKVVFESLTDLHAKTITALIECPPEDLRTRQGHAQIIDEILDAFSTAMKPK